MVKDSGKSKAQLIADLEQFRNRIAEMEASETERKRAEEMRRCERYNLVAVFEAMEDGVYIVDQQENIEYVNPALEKEFGPWKGRKCYEYFHDREEVCTWCKNQEVWAGKTVRWEWYSVKNGKTYDLIDTPLKNADGTISKLEIFRDITERKETEEALRKAHAFAESLIETAQAIVLVLDTEGRIVRFNPYFEQIAGYRLDEVKGKDWFSTFLPGRDRLRIRELFSQAMADIQTRGDVNSIVTKRGDERQIEWYDKTLKDADGNVVGLLAVGQDITERKRAEEEKAQLEEQLGHAQKMEAVGTLAGGMAHEFNNLLTGMLAYVHLALDEVEEGSSLHTDIARISELAVRAGELIRDLLAFSRRQRSERVPVDLSAMVEKTGRLLRSLASEEIHMEFALSHKPVTARADRSQIQQVLMNLVTNACDAMPRGGKLSIETVEVSVDESYTEDRDPPPPGQYALITVTDTGCGMDDVIQARIFEPFFTTKTVGEGTGLGLSTVYGIVKQHGGYVSVDSQLGEGATFRVYLPVVEVPSIKTPSESSIESRPKSAGTVLVVDDDKALLEVVSRILENAGYAVFSANCADEAEEQFTRKAGSIDLLLTDVVMPGRSGRKLYESLAEKNPQLKVLYMSGYEDRVVTGRGVSTSAGSFLEKPFKPDVLLQTVQQVLSG